jgi:hypothetical protein
MKLEYPGITGNGEIYLDVMKAICGETKDKSMLDLMAYHAPYTPLLGFKERTYVDIQDRGLDHKEEQEYFIQSDVLEYLNNESCPYFNISICSDGLEHLTDFDGLHLLKLMNLKSDKQILFTPLGEWMVTTEDHPDNHRSGWTPEILESIKPDYFAYIVFPDFHKAMNTGAFFFWHTIDIKQDFERVKNELNNKSWSKFN